MPRRSLHKTDRRGSVDGAAAAALDAVGAGIEAGELALQALADRGRHPFDELLDLVPRAGTRSVELTVVRLIEDDDLVAECAQRDDVVRTVVDVRVGFHFGLRTEEADVAVRDAR